MLKLLRWMAVSFSMYSRIPVPRFTWQEDDMKYSLLFFPMVGLVIGGVTLGIHCIPAVSALPLFVRSIVTLLVPVLMTGGFHLDGFMDTEDALRSYQPRDRKLEILKDPHIGAFAVIGLGSCMLVAAAAIGTVLCFGSRRTLIVLAAVFVVSRALAGILALRLPKARKKGMLAEETKGKQGVLLAVLSAWLMAGIAVMLAADWIAGVAVTVCLVLSLIRYAWLTAREFGGVTGDTTGYFITFSEAASFAVLAVIAWRPWA